MRCFSWLVALAGCLSACGNAGTMSDAGADATVDAGHPAHCVVDTDCTDPLYCNGDERCAPSDVHADPRGCVAGAARCSGTDVCSESLRRCVAPGCDDADGDGLVALACGGTDCDDGDRDRYPGNAERCDPGARDHDEDCDPCTVASATTGDGDLDHDGYLAAVCANVAAAATSCADTHVTVDAAHMRVTGRDCDDMQRDVHPDEPEVCNGIDDDCNGMIDDGVLRLFHRDADDDRYGDPTGATMLACGPPSGYVENATDCDDTNAHVNPARREICNGIDDDCNGMIDDGVAAAVLYRDADGDGAGDLHSPSSATSCMAPPGFVLPSAPVDCDDTLATVHPGATELCDALDDDCSSGGGPDPTEDADGDGHAPPSAMCTGGDPKDDCDDACPTCPGGVEICDGHDNDCDGTVDAPIPALDACGADATCGSSGCTSNIGIGVGFGYTCAIRASGQLACWGENAVGQLGDGTTVARFAPTDVAGIDDALEVSAGYHNTCVRRASDEIWCWGSNYFGQVGDALTHTPCEDELGFAGDCAYTPVPVGLADAAQLVGGQGFACARSLGGAVRCWGSNANGQVGDGTTAAVRPSPVSVVGLADAVDISASYRHACARRVGGAIVCWGSNGYGELGDGTTVDRSTPVAVVGLTGVSALTLGTAHSCARTASGAVSCWGSNASGELGDGTTTQQLTPVAVTGLAAADEVAAGDSFTCARVGGEVWCWGRNDTGQLGDGTTTGRGTPAVVVGLSDAVGLACNYSACCARRSTGGVACWGLRAIGDGMPAAALLAPGDVPGLP